MNHRQKFVQGSFVDKRGCFFCVFFCTSARPFPAGGFPPKVLQGNAGHLGDCFSAEKYRYAITFLVA